MLAIDFQGCLYQPFVPFWTLHSLNAFNPAIEIERVPNVHKMGNVGETQCELAWIWPLILYISTMEYRSAINRYWAYGQCQNLPNEQIWTMLLNNWVKNCRKTANFVIFAHLPRTQGSWAAPRRATVVGMVLKDVWRNFVHTSKISDKSVWYF